MLVESKPMMSTAGSSQTMKLLSRESRFHSNFKPQTSGLSSPASSSTSSITSKHFQVETEKQHKSKNPCESCLLKEENQQHETVELDETQRRSVLDLDLHEATLGTNSEHLDPTRDGVFARVRRILLQHGTSAAVGSVMGVGAFEMMRTTFTTTTTTMRTTQESKNLRDVDEIIDML